MFAGLILVCFFPFLAVVSAAAGRDLGPAITVLMGLNAQAAHDVDALISDGHQTVFGSVRARRYRLGPVRDRDPGVLQAWYEKVYDQPPAHGSLRQLLCKLVWVAGFLVYLALEVLIGRQAGRPAGMCSSSSASSPFLSCSSGGRCTSCWAAGPAGGRCFPPPWPPRSASPASPCSPCSCSRRRSSRARRATGPSACCWCCCTTSSSRRLRAHRGRLRPDVERTPQAARLRALRQRTERNGREVAFRDHGPARRHPLQGAERHPGSFNVKRRASPGNGTMRWPRGRGCGS